MRKAKKNATLLIYSIHSINPNHPSHTVSSHATSISIDASININASAGTRIDINAIIKVNKSTKKKTTRNIACFDSQCGF